MNYLEIILDVSIVTAETQDIMIACLSHNGFDSFEQKKNILHAFTTNTELCIEDFLKLSHGFPFSFNIKSFKMLEDKNWNGVWESNFKPVLIDGCYIRAPFHDALPNIKFDILISPNMSFGTGHHETTSLMVSSLLEVNCLNKSVLDVGSGTGILSILAEQKRASNIFAIDIDSYAYYNTIDNAKLNNCQKISVFNSDISSLIGNKKFDIILANINKNIIISQITNYVQLMSRGASLIISGFFESDFLDINSLLLEQELILQHDISKNNWKCAVYIK